MATAATDPRYRIDSVYWTDGYTYRLRSTDPTADGPYLDLYLPDATPAGEHYTASGPQHAEVSASEGGSVPWPVLYWFLGKLMGIGDLSGLRGPVQPMPSHDVWVHDGIRYEVSPNRLAGNEANYLEVEPGVSLTAHGRCTFPWPILRRFLAAVERSRPGA